MVEQISIKSSQVISIFLENLEFILQSEQCPILLELY